MTAVQASILVVVVIAVDVAVSGFLVFANARTDDLRQADAIIVLGGEHDGREDYGISLARGAGRPPS